MPGMWKTICTKASTLCLEANILRLTSIITRDVMTRHATLHGSTRQKPRKVSWQVDLFIQITDTPLIDTDSLSCVKLKVRCDGVPGTTCSRCESARRLCQYRSQVDTPSPVRTVDQTEGMLTSTDLCMEMAGIQPMPSLLSAVNPFHTDTRRSPSGTGTAPELLTLPADGTRPALNFAQGTSIDCDFSLFILVDLWQTNGP